MPGRSPWIWGGISATGNLQDVIDQLDERMADLEDWVQASHRETTFGPVPGSYFTISLGREDATGTVIPTGDADIFRFSFELRPIHLSAVVFGGDLTMDLSSEGSSILSAGSLSLSDGTAQELRARGDFAVEKITGDVTLAIDSVDASVPEKLSIFLTCKSASKIEPA